MANQAYQATSRVPASARGEALSLPNLVMKIDADDIGSMALQLYECDAISTQPRSSKEAHMKHTQHEAQKDKTVFILLPGVCLLQCNREKPVCRMDRVNQGTVCRNSLPVRHV